LYLALLLHDTGKATGSRHHAEASATLAQRVSARLQLSSEQRKSLLLLIDNHLTLSQTAQRRNLDEPATISEFANIVKNQLNLDRLMLLTVVDGLAVGNEEVWSDWKEMLVWQLYDSTTHYLKDHLEFYRAQRIERDELKAEVLAKLAADFEAETEAHFRYMPNSYFRTYPASDIVSHIRLFRQFLALRLQDIPAAHALAPAVKWIAHPDRGHSEVQMVTWDRSELLEKIAAALSIEKLNILSADVFTRGDSLVLDIFRVCETNLSPVTNERTIERVERNIRRALSEPDFDFAPLMEKAQMKQNYALSREIDFPTRIVVANDSQPIYTLIEIQTPDRLGLLHNLLRAFGRENISIAISRITTEKGAAIDSFYVQDSNGNKITDEADIRRLTRVLHLAAVGESVR
jgi:[protein-PII] uridylyltransferase